MPAPVMGGVAPSVRSLMERIESARSAARMIAARRPPPRGERLSGIHNPWGHAAGLADAWSFLDLCEHPALLDKVEQLIGQDIVLWDSQLYLEGAAYLQFASEGREGRYWPVEPLAGALVLVGLGAATQPVICVELSSMRMDQLSPLETGAPLYVVRYMPATSRFVRDARSSANRIAMEEQPLVNYATRPLWLVRGDDQARNDFVTGFSPAVPRWAGTQPKEH
jgi:hypothetical protein